MDWANFFWRGGNNVCRRWFGADFQRRFKPRLVFGFTRADCLPCQRRTVAKTVYWLYKRKNKENRDKK